jgi:hypothetical protein
MADDTNPAPETHETPYVMQMPDGSTQSRVLVTDQPVTHGDVAAYVASQGGTYLGPPQAPQPQPPAPPTPGPVAPPSANYFGGYEIGANAPLSYAFAPPMIAPPSPATAPPPQPAPAATSTRDVYFPQRSFRSQVPSILGATVFGTTAGGLTAPLGPELAIPIGMGAAGVGGAIGEGTQILGEKFSGAPPAEPGTALERMGNAFTRSATAEGLLAPVQYLPLLARSTAKPIADAAERLRPVLTGTEETPSALGQWWARASQMAPADIVKDWAAQDQAKLAGEYLPDMQTVIKTIAKGAAPIPRLGEISGGAAGVATALGHPYQAAGYAIPAARQVVTQGIPTVASAMLRNPDLVPWVMRLPRIGEVAGPLISVPLRATSQGVMSEQWPRTQDVFIGSEPQ